MSLVIWGGATLGFKGLSGQGIPVTKNRYITGTSAQVVGVICLVIGLGGVLMLVAMILGTLL
ncbi:MAG TPA: hypothetical protein VJX67_24570 [Blastocatellia bacterium]|nr:hypothetical protein [Blastocatellia bacterium]